MKKLILISLLFIGFNSFSQTQDGFAMVVATPKAFSTKFTITIDYGDAMKLFSDNRMRDEQGKVATFNSIVDVLNYMSKQGWIYVHVLTTPISAGNVYSFIFRKPVD